MKPAILKKDVKSFQSNFSKNNKFKVTRNALTISNPRLPIQRLNSSWPKSHYP